MSTDTPTQRENGLDPEGRYEVRKINDPTGKHDECAYFVLDPQHDPGARFALRAYKVWASRNGYGPLAEDLDRWLSEVDGLPGSAADTPTPERVTLTDEEMRVLHDRFLRYSIEPGEWARLIAPAVERILAAREQALREESWEACWSSIAEAAWPEGGATRSEVLSLVLGARPAGGAR